MPTSSAETMAVHQATDTPQPHTRASSSDSVDSARSEQRQETDCSTRASPGEIHTVDSSVTLQSQTPLICPIETGAITGSSISTPLQREAYSMIYAILDASEGSALHSLGVLICYVGYQDGVSWYTDAIGHHYSTQCFRFSTIR